MRHQFHIDLSTEQWLALTRYGYDPALPPRGVSGPPGRINGYVVGTVAGQLVHFPLRNRVCVLEGITIDGHEPSDLDPNGPCLHCDYDGPDAEDASDEEPERKADEE